MLSGAWKNREETQRSSKFNTHFMYPEHPTAIRAAAHTEGLLTAFWKKKSWDQLLFNIYPAPVMTATSTLLRYFSCLFCFVFAKEMELDGAGL